MKGFEPGASTDLIKAELEYLVVFAKKFNEMAFKGVHAQVTESEAKQGLLGLYLFLANLIEKLEYNTPNNSMQPTADVSAK